MNFEEEMRFWRASSHYWQKRSFFWRQDGERARMVSFAVGFVIGMICTLWIEAYMG